VERAPLTQYDEIVLRDALIDALTFWQSGFHVMARPGVSGLSQGPRRASFFFEAYSRSEKLFCNVDGEAKPRRLSQITSPLGTPVDEIISAP
jgi:hypothetical protein